MWFVVLVAVAVFVVAVLRLKRPTVQVPAVFVVVQGVQGPGVPICGTCTTTLDVLADAAGALGDNLLPLDCISYLCPTCQGAVRSVAEGNL